MCEGIFINNLIVHNGMEKRGNNFKIGGILQPKRAQITIFVIIAVVIIGGAILFFAFTNTGKGIVDNIVGGGTSSTGFDFEDELETCVVEDALIDSKIETILINGGEMDPKVFYLFGGDKYNYLCLTDDYYEGCVNQKPLLLQQVEKEIEESITPHINACVKGVENQLKSNGWSVRGTIKSISIDIVDGNINIKIDYPLTIERGDERRIYDEGFEVKKMSEAYRLILVSTSIVEFESEYGDSEIVAYMSLYPNTRIEKLKQGEGTTLYKVSDRNTGESFNFASRSYVIPPGYRT